MTDQKNELPQEVADRYELKYIEPGLHFVPGFGEVDTTKLSVKDAAKLVNKGFPYLVEKPVVEPAPAVSETTVTDLSPVNKD